MTLILLSPLMASAAFLFSFIILIYIRYGIDSWTDLVREMSIIRAKCDFAWSQFTIKRKNINYVDQWKTAVSRFGRNVFLVKDKNEVYTYNQVDVMSNALAKFLYEKNITEDVTVGIMMTNSVEFVVTWLALIKLGARPALLNSNLRGISLSYCLKILDECKMVLRDERVHHEFNGETKPDKLLKIPFYTVQFTSNATGTYIIGQKALELVKSIPDTENPEKFAGNKKGYDSVIAYLFTSGTTGYPKAVPFTFNKLWSILKICFIKRYSITQKDTIYSTLPLYHSTALCIGLHISMLTGGRYVLREKLSVNSFWSDVKCYEATIFLYVGEMCRFLLNRKINFHPKAGYKTRLCIGNGLGADIYTEFKETFRIPQIAEFYGQTEGFAFFGSVLQKPGSLGYLPKFKFGPNPYRVIKCDVETMHPVREHRTGLCKLCNFNERGLLLVRTYHTHKDHIYHNNTGDVRMVYNVEVPGDRYISTGDLVLIGSDRSYYFVDRLGDTFRWKGENVSTTEVSSCLHHIKEIQEACVYGVHVPGHDGKAGMAAVLLQSESDLSMPDLYSVLYENLPKYAIPLFIRMVNSLDITSTHKYKTSQLQSDGFDPRVSPKIYLINHKDRSYRVITENLFRQINSGDVVL